METTVSKQSLAVKWLDEPYAGRLGRAMRKTIVLEEGQYFSSLQPGDQIAVKMGKLKKAKRWRAEIVAFPKKASANDSHDANSKVSPSA